MSQRPSLSCSCIAGEGVAGRLGGPEAEVGRPEMEGPAGPPLAWLRHATPPTAAAA